MKYLLLSILLAAQLRAIEVTANTDYVNNYTFRGQRVTENSLQGTVGLKTDNFYGSLWTNRSLERTLGSEIDATVGATLGNLEAGATAYLYPGQYKTTYEPFLGISHDIKGVNVSLLGYRDLTLKTTTVEGKLSVNALNLKKFRVNLDGVIGKTIHSFTYWSAGPTAWVPLYKNVAFNAQGQFTSSDDKNIKRNILTFKVGLSITK